jgi:hypothetical protein
MSVDEIWNRIRTEALGQFNRDCARQTLGHDPTVEEAVDHFLDHDGENYVKQTMGISTQTVTEQRQNL